MAKGINAQAGIEKALVGARPDTQNGDAGGRTRGMLLVGDDPYRQNNMIPGQEQTPNNSSFGGSDTYNSYDDFNDEANGGVEQGEEGNYDDDTLVGDMSRMDWSSLGRRCYDTANTYYRSGNMNSHILASHMFKGQHAPSSKYNTAAYRNRSKIFRPMTRMAARGYEADVASALFMNDDYMHITARNMADPDSEQSAAVLNELVDLRLDEMGWYTICIGAAQDAFINGPVISKVYWRYEATMKQEVVPVMGMNGEMIGYNETEHVKVTHNAPQIELILPENFLYDPNAAWNDVVNTSEYFVHRKKMSVAAIKSKMRMAEWFPFSTGKILTASWSMADEVVNQAKRGEGQPNPADNDYADRDYEAIMVNECFVKREGCWYVYHMLGTQWLLEDPQPLENRYAFGRLPFVYGTAMIESHTTSPDSKATVGRELQASINDTANARMDNVRLSMNKRYLAKRGINIDLESLTRSSPGGVTVTADPTNDIRELTVTDVTANSYEEVNRLTTEMNELQGTFSGQGVANNNNMNETVGGLKMLSQAASKVNDYDIRTFVNTWVRPTLELVMLAIQYYESDQLIMELAVTNAATFPRLKVEDLSDDLMTKQLMMQVDVGVGATDPVQRVNTIKFALQSVAELPGMAEQMDSKAAASTIFAALGMGDGSRLFPSLAKNYQEPEAAPPPPDPLVLAAQEEAKGRVEAENIRAQTQMQLKQMELDNNKQIQLIKMALDAEMQGKDLQNSVLLKLIDVESRNQIAAATDKTKRQTTVLQHGSAVQQTAMQQAQGIANEQTPTQQSVNDAAAQQITGQ